MQSFWSDGGIRWVWKQTEAGLVDGMFNGLAICFPVAFVVLLFATSNVVVAVFAITSIVGIVGTILGFCQSVMGWYLGIAEAIASVIVIGFSVDYVVHLGHMFQHSTATTRSGKVADAARAMGPTVMGGAGTTLGSGLFMFACQMTFFTKMAVLISGTIFFSFLFSLGFFMALCNVLGPEGSLGDVRWIWMLLCGEKIRHEVTEEKVEGTTEMVEIDDKADV